MEQERARGSTLLAAAADLNLRPSFRCHEHTSAETLSKKLTGLGNVVFEEEDRAQRGRAVGRKGMVAKPGEHPPPRHNP